MLGGKAPTRFQKQDERLVGIGKRRNRHLAQVKQFAPMQVGLDTPYDDDHVRAVLDRVQTVMAEDWPRRAKLGELAFKVQPGEWVDPAHSLTR